MWLTAYLPLFAISFITQDSVEPILVLHVLYCSSLHCLKLKKNNSYSLVKTTLGLKFDPLLNVWASMQKYLGSCSPSNFTTHRTALLLCLVLSVHVTFCAFFSFRKGATEIFLFNTFFRGRFFLFFHAHSTRWHVTLQSRRVRCWLCLRRSASHPRPHCHTGTRGQWSRYLRSGLKPAKKCTLYSILGYG